MNCIKLWWCTKVLKKVVYKPNGRPYDCKGLKFTGRDPFGEYTVYHITKDYDGCTYAGGGVYISSSGKSVFSDRRNPYYQEAYRVAKSRCSLP